MPVPLERRGGGLVHSENADEPVRQTQPPPVRPGSAPRGLELGAQKGLRKQPLQDECL